MITSSNHIRFCCVFSVVHHRNESWIHTIHRCTQVMSTSDSDESYEMMRNATWVERPNGFWILSVQHSSDSAKSRIQHPYWCWIHAEFLIQHPFGCWTWLGCLIFLSLDIQDPKSWVKFKIIFCRGLWFFWQKTKSIEKSLLSLISCFIFSPIFELESFASRFITLPLYHVDMKFANWIGLKVF